MISIKHAKFWTDSSNILFCQFNNSDSNIKLDENSTKLFLAIIIDLCKGKAMPFLIDLRNSRGTFSSSAAKLLTKSTELKKIRISEAFVTKSIAMILLIRSYKRIYNPKTPFGVFNDIDTAKDYCIETKNKFYEYI